MKTLKETKNWILLLIIRIITFDYFVIRKTIANWIPNKQVEVLDMGCGLGYFANLFNKKGYLGIDIDPESISIAKRIHPKYSFQVGDATSFISKKKFDLILVVGVLHHLSDKQVTQCLKTMKDSIRKNGRLIIMEAIPPILKINFLGKILRSLDQGDYIRPIKKYENSISKKFDIIYSKEKLGGLVDYGVIIAINKVN